MNDLQNVKWQNVTPPAAIVDNAAFTTGSVDCKGFGKAMFLVTLGALDITIVAMKLRESDDDSAYTDVTGADFSVPPLTLPAATDDNKVYAIYVNLKGRKRYLDLSLTGGDGTSGSYITVLAALYNGSEVPNSATERGIAQQAFV